MNKPVEIVQLLEELAEESCRNTVEVHEDSHAHIFLSPNDRDPVCLDPEDCKLLLDSRETVKRMVDALEQAGGEEMNITLFDVTVTDSVSDALERMFTAVDEG